MDGFLGAVTAFPASGSGIYHGVSGDFMHRFTKGIYFRSNYTFAKKISHTADSQDQRHRMVPGSRPLLTLADTRTPDYITPMLLENNRRAKELYERAMHDAWHAKNELVDRGVPEGDPGLRLLSRARPSLPLQQSA